MSPIGRVTIEKLAACSNGPECLYVAEIGDKVKVGVTRDLRRRLDAHARHARQVGAAFEPLMARMHHLEARSNELALVRQFGNPGSTDEHFAADSVAVMRALRELPCTPCSPDLWAKAMAPLHQLRVMGLVGAAMTARLGPQK